MMSGVLLFLAGLAVAVCQGVMASGGINKSVVCINNDMTLELTILRGEDGKIGRPGLKGVPGDGGFGQGEIGVANRGEDGPPGPDGRAGIDGEMGDWGETGNKGPSGPPGISGMKGIKGEAGEPGKKGQKGETGSMAELGLDGDDGDPGPDGLPLLKDIKDLLIHALNDYQVTESGYYNNIYHVTSRDLTDGRTDTGGWGSETAKTGNYIQATFLRPVYVTSVTVAGGFVPSWGHDIRRGYGKLKLEYSTDGNNWKTSTTFPSPMVHKMVTLKFTPVIAQYWRLISSEDKWVGTTEFALEPLIKT